MGFQHLLEYLAHTTEAPKLGVMSSHEEDKGGAGRVGEEEGRKRKEQEERGLAEGGKQLKVEKIGMERERENESERDWRCARKKLKLEKAPFEKVMEQDVEPEDTEPAVMEDEPVRLELGKSYEKLNEIMKMKGEKLVMDRKRKLNKEAEMQEEEQEPRAVFLIDHDYCKQDETQFLDAEASLVESKWCFSHGQRR